MSNPVEVFLAYEFINWFSVYFHWFQVMSESVGNAEE